MFSAKRYLLITAALLLLMVPATTHRAFAQCCQNGCGLVGNATNAVLSIPVSMTRSLGYQDSCTGTNDCCGCYSCGTGCYTAGHHSGCGVIGSIADAIVSIPGKILRALTPQSNGGHNCCGCCCGCVEYPCGCANGCCASHVIEVAPAVRQETVPPAPVYVTYGIVSRTPPVRPVPPVVTFNGPLRFDR